MGRRFATTSKPSRATSDLAGPRPQPLSPKSNWVSNVQALNGTGPAKVGESFDDEAQNAVMKPVHKIAEPVEAKKTVRSPAGTAATTQQTVSKKNAKRSKSQKKTRPSSPTKPDTSLHSQSVSAAVPPPHETNHTGGEQQQQVKPPTPTDPTKGKPVSQINAAAVLSVLAPTSPRSLSSPKQKVDAERPKSPQSKKGDKRGGNFKWFRKGRKEKDQQQQQTIDTQNQKSPRTPRSIFGSMRNPTSPSSEITKEVASPAYTSPLRMQLWIGAVQQTIVKVVETEPEPEPEEEPIPEEPEMMMPPPIQNPTSFYRHTVDTGVYVDYSTFDDGESVSSIDLLFKWLTCRDVTAEPKPTSIQTNNTQVESDVSFDAEAQPRRRVLFSP